EFTDRFETYMRRQLEEMLIYGVEPDNVLFGTDWPISSMDTYVEFMDQLSIPGRDKRKIMAENSLKLFRIDPSTSLLATRRASEWGRRRGQRGRAGSRAGSSSDRFSRPTIRCSARRTGSFVAPSRRTSWSRRATGPTRSGSGKRESGPTSPGTSSSPSATAGS